MDPSTPPTAQTTLPGMPSKVFIAYDFEIGGAFPEILERVFRQPPEWLPCPMDRRFWRAKIFRRVWDLFSSVAEMRVRKGCCSTTWDSLGLLSTLSTTCVRKTSCCGRTCFATWVAVDPCRSCISGCRGHARADVRSLAATSARHTVFQAISRCRGAFRGSVRRCYRRATAGRARHRLVCRCRGP
jgi:hypothetical protein